MSNPKTIALGSIYSDRFIVRKRELVQNNLRYWRNTPLFSIVEISVIAACNRRCSFCPVSDSYYKKLSLKGVMKKSLYEKLLDDLCSINYSGMILFSGEGEPLLHKRLHEWIKTTKMRLPNSIIEVNTNGDLLNLDNLTKLFKSGLDAISISMYDGPHQIASFETLRKKAMLSPDQVFLRRRYLENGDLGMVMSNRGGIIEIDKFQQNVEQVSDYPLKKNCYYPFYYMVLDMNGNITMCSHDWGKKFVCGNILQSDIFSIWTNERMAEARQKLSSCNRNLSSCEKCNVVGELIGKESFSAWLNIEKNNT
jgi:radical SAM protein with 4Fe4S-binding SPASM domain